jgi:hypothetical protein
MKYSNVNFRPVLKSKYEGQLKLKEQFGYWEVIDTNLYTQTYNEYGAIYVRCICIECREEHIISYYSLLNSRTSNSGGCKKCIGKRKRIIGNLNYNWKGFGEIPKSYINNISNAARLRGIDFNVSIEYLWDLYLKQDRKCILSDVSIDFKSKTASLDRVDSARPYEEGNVQWVHKVVNEMKWSKTDSELVFWCNLICEHQRKNNV